LSRHWYVALPLQLLTDELNVGPLVYPVHRLVEPLLLMLTVGVGLTVTVTLFDVALQPPHVTTSVYTYVPAFNPAGTV
jgi:hypothetical protein